MLTVESLISEKESGNLEQKGKRNYLRLILKLALLYNHWLLSDISAFTHHLIRNHYTLTFQFLLAGIAVLFHSRLLRFLSIRARESIIIK